MNREDIKELLKFIGVICGLAYGFVAFAFITIASFIAMIEGKNPWIFMFERMQANPIACLLSFIFGGAAFIGVIVMITVSQNDC